VFVGKILCCLSAAQSGNGGDVCYILDGILIVYGVVLTVLYCRLKVKHTHTHTHTFMFYTHLRLNSIYGDSVTHTAKYDVLPFYCRFFLKIKKNKKNISVSFFSTNIEIFLNQETFTGEDIESCLLKNVYK